MRIQIGRKVSTAEVTLYIVSTCNTGTKCVFRIKLYNTERFLTTTLNSTATSAKNYYTSIASYSGNGISHELCVFSRRVEDTEWDSVGDPLHFVDHSLDEEGFKQHVLMFDMTAEEKQCRL